MSIMSPAIKGFVLLLSVTVLAAPTESRAETDVGPGTARLQWVQAIQRDQVPEPSEPRNQWDCDVGVLMIGYFNHFQRQSKREEFKAREEVTIDDLKRIAKLAEAPLEPDNFKKEYCTDRALNEANAADNKALQKVAALPDGQKTPPGKAGDPNDPNKQLGDKPDPDLPKNKTAKKTDGGTVDDGKKVSAGTDTGRKVQYAGYTDLKYYDSGVLVKVNDDCLTNQKIKLRPAVTKFILENLKKQNSKETMVEMIEYKDGVIHYFDLKKNSEVTESETNNINNKEFMRMRKYIDTPDGLNFIQELESLKYKIVLLNSENNVANLFGLFPSKSDYKSSCIDFTSYIFSSSDKFGEYFLGFSRIIDVEYSKDVKASKVNSTFVQNDVYSLILEGTSGSADADLSGKRDQLLMLNPKADPFEVLSRLDATEAFVKLVPIKL